MKMERGAFQARKAAGNERVTCGLLSLIEYWLKRDVWRFRLWPKERFRKLLPKGKIASRNLHFLSCGRGKYGLFAHIAGHQLAFHHRFHRRFAISADGRHNLTGKTRRSYFDTRRMQGRHFLL